MMSRSSAEHGHAIAGVFVFLLLGVFALFSTMLVLIGAQAYRATTAHSEEHGAARTLYAYVYNTVRGDDVAGIIETREEQGIDVLAVHYEFDDESYIKRVYCWEGNLRELLTSAKAEFTPAAGEVISPLEEFEAKLTNGLLTVDMTDAYGHAQTVQVVLRTMR